MRADKIRAIAMSGAQRAGVLPDLPAIAELYPGYEVPTWGAVFAPLGTPPEIVDRLSREIAAIMKQPDVQQKFRDLGSEPVGSTPAELGARGREAVRERFHWEGEERRLVRLYARLLCGPGLRSALEETLA